MLCVHKCKKKPMLAGGPLWGGSALSGPLQGGPRQGGPAGEDSTREDSAREDSARGSHPRCVRSVHTAVRLLEVSVLLMLLCSSYDEHVLFVGLFVRWKPVLGYLWSLRTLCLKSTR